MGKIKNALLAALVMTSIVGCSNDSESKTPVTKESSKESASEIKKEAPKPTVGITKSNYDKAIEGDSITGEGGSTIAEVEVLMGDEPTFNTTKEIQGVTIYSATYNAFESGEVLTFTFSNGKLAQKAYKKL